jgi:hypothetical protein
VKQALLALIGALCLVLVVGLFTFLLGGLDRFARRPPKAPVFRPRIYEARAGDLVRYERRDKAGRVLGYLDYEVMQVVRPEGTTIGDILALRIKETDEPRAGETMGRSRERVMRVQPRALMHGFLPPRFEDEDDYPAGERPVVSRIETATFQLRDPPPPPKPPPPPVRGFLVEAVVPRRSLTEVLERYWMTSEVPVFGVARFERDGEVLILHRMEPGK